MNKNVHFLLFALALLMPALSSAQPGSGRSKSAVIEEALALSTRSFYRSTAFSIDLVEGEMIMGKWRPPREGQSIILSNGKKSKWKKIKAGEDGWFKDTALRGGYVYIPVYSKSDKSVLLEGMSHQMVFVNGQPRVGNRYQYKEDWSSWEPHFDFSLLPVHLHKGRNDLLFRCNRGRLKVRIHPVVSPVSLNIYDLTLPDFIVGRTVNDPASVVVMNATQTVQDHLYLSASWEDGKTTTSSLPAIRPMTIRKSAFILKGGIPAKKEKGKVHLILFTTRNKVKVILDEKDIVVRVVEPENSQKHTFISGIDGSVQYYALNPAKPDPLERKKALVLSVHGADVEAINQASSYGSKTWANIVCPTNRRPYGFDWEDWGRLDALEVLEIAKQTLPVDESRIYLTGHSMGGHGTWILGAQYPDQFGAIGPSAGWISWWSYRVRGKEEGQDAVNAMIMRATLPSHTFALSRNYKQLGIYIIHGSKDDNVSPQQSHMMVDTIT